MKYPLLCASAVLASLALPGAQAEQPHFQWNRAMLNLIESGDAQRGAVVAEDNKCAKCHEDDGISLEVDTPSLAGQRPAYLVKQLMDYKSGLRSERSMNKAVRNLTPENITDLAAFYASQTGLTSPEREAPPMVTQGDKSRYLLACDDCHGKNGEGMGLEVPALAGQTPEYLEVTLTEYREGDRINDHYGRMQYISKMLTEAEIEAIVAYYAAEMEEE